MNYRLSQNWLLDVGYRWIDDIPDVESDLYEFTVGGRYLFGVDEPVPLPPIAKSTLPPEPELKEVVVSIDAETLFKFDSDEVQVNEALLRAVDDIGTTQQIIVVGHTDSTGSAAYNMALSLRRAVAIKDFMVLKGIPENNILVQGRGEEEPIASNDTHIGRNQNRRVEIRYHCEGRGINDVLVKSNFLFNYIDPGRCGGDSALTIIIQVVRMEAVQKSRLQPFHQAQRAFG